MSKSDGLCPRYKQPCGVGIHVDISTHRQEGVNIVLNVKAVVAAFNQEKAIVGAFSVITNLRMKIFEALLQTADTGAVCEEAAVR